MAVKILAILVDASTVPACLGAASAAAERIPDGQVEALHVVVDPQSIIVADEEIAFQELREQREGTAQERSQAVHESYIEWTKGQPHLDIPFRWKKLVGTEEEAVVKEASSFDVLAMATPHNADAADALHAALFKIGRPFFLVPSEWRFRSAAPFADHVVIAWNGTEACDRAAQGALPWLLRASQVTILAIDGDEAVERPIADLLRRENIAHQIHRCSRDEERQGDEILTKSHELGADLLVMGAYRHGPLLEWLLGGTTREVLKHTDLPLFLAH